MPRSKVKCPNPGHLVVNLKRHPDKSLSNACELQLVGAGGATDLTVQVKKRTTFEKLPPGGYNLWVRPSGEEASFDIDEKIGPGPENPLGQGLQNRPVAIVAKTTTIHHYKFKPYELIIKVVDDSNPNKTIQHVTVTAKHANDKEMKKVTGQDGLANFGFVPRPNNFNVTIALRREDEPKYQSPLPSRANSAPQHLGSNPYQIQLIRVVTLYLRLLYKDPEENERPFPPGVPLRLEFTDGTNEHLDVVTGAQGDVFLPGTTNRPIIRRRRAGFTLALTQNQDRFIRVEPDGASARECHLENAAPDPSQAAPAGPPAPPYAREYGLKPARWFQLPRDPWNLENSTWEVRHAAHYTRPDFDRLQEDATTVGTHAQPVQLVLDPHWQYLRFVYFDRWLKQKTPVSIPPVAVTGHYPPLPPPNTKALWNINTAKDGFTTVQCLPWIIQPTAGHKPDQTVGIGFTTAARTFIETAEDRRSRKILTQLDQALMNTPSVKRLRYYDLPGTWKSLNYFCHLGNAENTFAQLADRIAHPTSADEPLTFNLDDIVLTSADAATPPVLTPVAVVANQRMALFHHQFRALDDDGGRAGATYSTVGLYRPGAATPAGAAITYPYSHITLRADPHRNYLTDHPYWTRLVVTAGNLFDVFNLRTGQNGEPEGANSVIGARAGVNWVDAVAPAPNGVGIAPGNLYDPRPAATRRNFFAVQPFFRQVDPPRHYKFGTAGQDFPIGRCDIALLRCCDAEGSNERAITLKYIRYFYITPTANRPATDPVNPNQPLSADELATMAAKVADNVVGRWNGGTGDPFNPDKTDFLPEAVANAPAVKARPLWFIQRVTEPRAHVRVEVLAIRRASMNSWYGTGKLGFETGESEDTPVVHGWFTAAHESGHIGAQPDEYGETEDEASYGQYGFRHNLPGDPYAGEGHGIMHWNEQIHNRHLWDMAEWTRCQLPATTPRFMVSKGKKYKDYLLPSHPNAPERRYYSWPWHQVVDHQFNATRSLFDAFLFAVGKDYLSAVEFPAKSGKKPAFDGILSINLKLRFVWRTSALDNYGIGHEWRDSSNVDFTTYWLDTFLSHAVAWANHQFGFRFYATGTCNGHTFQRCLIRVVLRFLVENATPEALTRTGQPDQNAYNTQVTNVENWAGRHGRIIMIDNANPDFQWRAGAPAGANTNGTDNARIVEIATPPDLFAANFAQTTRHRLGLVVRNLLNLPDTGRIKAVDLRPIARVLMPDAEVHTFSLF